MKSLLTLLAILFAVNFSYAQWITTSGNTTTTDNVGIGTTAPLSSFTVGSNTSNMQSTTGITLGVGQNNLEFLNSTFGSGFGAKIYGVDSGSGVTTLRIATRGNSTTWKDAFTINASASGNGNVGIGTTSPEVPLQIGNYSANQAITLAAGSAGTSIIRFNTLNNTQGNFISSTDANSQYGNSLIQFGRRWNADATPAVTFNLGTGNVGIGTESPSSQLHVESSANSSWATQIINNGTTNANGLYVNIGSGSTGVPFRVDVNGSDMFQVSNNGNIAIGTTDSQGHKLAINGDIIATKITVKPYANWPDYVFKPQYHLPSLAEVKKYIDQNQHLPDVPSAATVEKDGQDLGEMNKILLKKVEELTLYMIEKDKEVKEIKDQKEDQQKQINELKSQLTQLLQQK